MALIKNFVAPENTAWLNAVSMWDHKYNLVERYLAR